MFVPARCEASPDTARPSSRQNQRLSTHAALQLTPLLGMLGQRAFHMKCGVRAIKWALFMRAVHMLRDSYRFEVSTWGRRPLRDSTAAPWADARNAQCKRLIPMRINIVLPEIAASLTRLLSCVHKASILKAAALVRKVYNTKSKYLDFDTNCVTKNAK